MDFVDYYAVLGLSQNASDDEIKKAIRAIRREYRSMEGSPDPDQRQRAENAMNNLAECERVLTNPTERAAYDATYASKKAATQQASAAAQRSQTSSSNDQANSLLDSASEYLKQGQNERAMMIAVEANKFNYAKDPNIPYRISHLFYAFADYRNAIDYAQEAVSLASNNFPLLAQAEDWVGTLYYLSGSYDSAASAFGMATSLEPNAPVYAAHAVNTKLALGEYREALTLAGALMTKYPNNQIIKNEYIVSIYKYIIHVIASHTEKVIASSADSEYWFTNPQQIEEARKYEALLVQLGSIIDQDVDALPNSNYNELIVEMRRRLDAAGKRSWDLPETKYLVVLGIAWIIFTICMFNFNPRALGILLWLLVTAAVIALGYWRCYCYGWQYNKRNCGSTIAKTGLQGAA